MQQYQALRFQALHLSGEQTQIPLILLKYNPLKRSQQPVTAACAEQINCAWHLPDKQK